MPHSAIRGRRFAAGAPANGVVAAALALGGCGYDEPAQQVKPLQPALRKQVYDLTATDLQRYPVWELALDEEGVEGQDEATVKPRPDLRQVDPGAGTFVVAARFTARDGTRFHGYVYVSGLQRHDLGLAQPTVVAGPNQIGFWFGIVEPTRAQIEEDYRRLGKNADELFPITFDSEVPAPGATLPRQIPGFLYLVLGEGVRTTR